MLTDPITAALESEEWNALLVIARFYEASDHCDEAIPAAARRRANCLTDSSIFAAFQTLRENGSVEINTDVLGDLRSHVDETVSFYEYRGSLTTPPYAEIVHWFVLADTDAIPVPHSVLHWLRTLSSELDTERRHDDSSRSLRSRRARHGEQPADEIDSEGPGNWRSVQPLGDSCVWYYDATKPVSS
ncbi:MAG: hypothetical protein MHM6MM_008548 [Cercozoa sp. M6MM]